MKTYEQEAAEALGFSSVEEMEDHQRWLAEQARQRPLIAEAVRKGAETGIIDVRHI